MAKITRIARLISYKPSSNLILINLILLFNSQVVERERNDAKAEQEKLNTQIQEFLKEVEVIIIKLLLASHSEAAHYFVQ